MTTFLGSYERPRRQPLGETSRIGRLVRLSEDTLSAVVELGNEQFELPVSPGKYVLGANVAVLESKGKPRRVSGPAGVWPEGLDADADAPDTVTAVEQLGPVEFSPEDQAILDQTVADLAVARQKIADAAVVMDEWDEVRLPALQDDLAANLDRIADAEADLEAAFPSGPFNVDAGIAGAIDALEVGGRNYMLNSAQPGLPFVIASNDNVASPLQKGTDEIGQWITGTDASTGDFFLSTYTNPTFESGRGTVFSDGFFPVPEVLTQSVEVMSEVAMPVRLGAAGADTFIQPNEWTKISSTLSNGSRLMGIRVLANPDVPVGTKVYHRNWKLERGTKATDWTPAPEDVYAGIDAALNMANGKNAVTYTDVADGVAEPGPAPSTTIGAGRPKHDMHRNRRSNGTIIGEWIWTGSAWTRLTLSDAMLSSLDVGKLTAGTGNLQTAVIQKLTAQLARLIEVDADKIVTGTIKGAVLDFNTIWAGVANLGKIITKELIANGAVTAEALNVVHNDPVTGSGWRAEPEGLVFLDRDGAPTITLRTDMANAFTVIKDGIPVATISPDGDVTGVNLVAHESFRYRGQELADRLDQQPRGEITASNLSEPLPIGPEWARVGHVTWTSDSGSRRYKATLSLATTNGTSTRVQVSARRSTGNTVESTNSLLQIFEHGDGRERNTRVHEFDFNSALTGEQSVGFFVRCVDGGTVTAMASNEGGATTKVTLADTGRAITEEPYIGYSPPIPGGGGGSGSDDAPAKSQHSKTFTATSFRTYSRTGLTHTRASQSVVHGAIAGTDSRGHWIWNIAAIRSALSGATNITGKLVIPVEHTYHGDGTDFVIKKHNYTSLPSTFGTALAWQTVRGKRQTEIVIPLDTTTLNQLQGVGTAAAGFSADPGAGTGLRNYGYLSRYARLEFNYRK